LQLDSFTTGKRLDEPDYEVIEQKEIPCIGWPTGAAKQMRDANEPVYEPPQPILPATAFSLIFHLFVLTLIGWMMRQDAGGTTSEVDRVVGVALVERLPDRDRYKVPETSEAKTRQEASNPDPTSAATAVAPPPAAPPPAASAPLIDLEGVLQEMTAGDVPSVGEGSIQGAFGDGVDGQGSAGVPKPGGAPTTTMVFGVTGSGSRFIYVFDRSDSMNGFGGSPLRAAKSELKRSIETLSEAQQFQIIFYNDEAKPFVPAGSPLALLTGDKSMRRRASAYVDSVRAFGGTEHYGALKMALRMGPDVIFFLTDARVPRLTANQLADVKRLAERAGTSIHAIEFGTESWAPEDSFLRQLASENRGEYRYIPVTQLSRDPTLGNTAAQAVSNEASKASDADTDEGDSQ